MLVVSLMSESKIPIEYVKTLLSYFACSHFSSFLPSLIANFSHYFSSTCFYLKDERSLPGNLHSRKYVSSVKRNVFEYSYLLSLSSRSFFPLYLVSFSTLSPLSLHCFFSASEVQKWHLSTWTLAFSSRQDTQLQ